MFSFPGPVRDCEGGEKFPIDLLSLSAGGLQPLFEDSDNWARKALCREDRTGLTCQLAILKHPDIFQLTTLQE